MQLFETVIDVVRQRWQRTTMSGRIGGALALALALGTIIVVGVWSARPQYVPLAVNLAPSETAEYISTLDAAGIANKMNFAGSGVLVPTKQLNKARVAVGDLLSPVAQGNDALDGSILGDPSTIRYRLLQQKENDLERTILRMRSVTSADVHIAQPRWSPFPRAQQATTASVVLGLRPGVVFTQEQAATIVALVSRSVEGLTDDNVTVSDLSGHTWTGKTSLGGAGMLSRLDYRARLEARLVANAQTILEQKLGHDKSIVRVAADIDFNEIVREKTIYDPDSKVKTSESIESTSGAVPRASGAVGVTANSPGGNQTQGAGVAQLSGDSESIDTEWENGKTVENTTVPSGGLIRLTVAAMVDLGMPGDGSGQPQGASDVTQEQIEGIIKAATGFDAARGDQIEVVITSLAPPPNTAADVLTTTDKWEFFNQLARNSSLGLAAVTALIIALVVLRKVKPITISTRHADEETQRREQLLSDLSRRVQENPETVSRILAAWLGETSQKAEPESDSEPDTIPMRRAA